MSFKFLRGLLFVAVLLFATSINSGAQNNFKVTVHLKDNRSGESVGFATVSVSQKDSKKVYKYSQADENGTATFTNFKAGDYVLSADLMGYETATKEFTVSNKDVDLGELKMTVQAQFLEGATVTDIGNPIVVKKDTIEYTASSFKTTETDVLADLLKKMPGFEVDDDGGVSFNGETIQGVYIDGQEFFGSNTQMATQNLSAQMINKVRAVNKKSDEAEFTGIDDGNERMVLDLSVKDEIKNTWFGNVTGGAGYDLKGADEDNDIRFTGNLMAASFGTAKQLAIIGNGNNANGGGFGGRGGFGGGGGNGGNGITTSYSIGANGSYTFKDKSEITGDYTFSGRNSLNESESNKLTFKKNGDDLRSHESGKSTSDSYTHQFGSRAEWNVGKNTSIIFEPSISFGTSGSYSYNEFTTDGVGSIADYKVNDGYSNSESSTDTRSLNGTVLLRQRLGKSGRNLTLNLGGSYSNNLTDGLNYSETNHYNSNSEFTDLALVDQHYNQTSNSYGANGRLTYTEPLGKNFYLEGNYSINFSQSLSEKLTYNQDANGNYTVLDNQYSNKVDNTRFNQQAGFNFRKQERKYNMTFGANVQPTNTTNVTLENGKETTINQKVVNWSPQARIDLNLNTNDLLRFNYNGQSSQPSMTQLNPVSDNSNPQRVTLGNPNLVESFSHRINTMYRKTNMKTFASLMLNVGANFSMRNIVNASWYDQNAVQYTVPMNNEKGTYSTNARLSYNTPIAKSNFSLMIEASGDYSNSYSFVGGSNIDPTDPSSYQNIANYTENKTDNVSAQGSLRFTYRNNLLEFNLGGNTRYQQAWYSVSEKNVDPTWTNNINANFMLQSDILNFNTDARYTFYKGFGEGYNDPTLVWNAEVNKSIFNKKATLALRLYDILNQSKSTRRTTTDNYVSDSKNNTLGRYFIVSIQFRFGSFGSMMGGGRGGRGGGMPGMPPGGPGQRFGQNPQGNSSSTSARQNTESSETKSDGENGEKKEGESEEENEGENEERMPNFPEGMPNFPEGMPEPPQGMPGGGFPGGFPGGGPGGFGGPRGFNSQE